MRRNHPRPSAPARVHAWLALCLALAGGNAGAQALLFGGATFAGGGERSEYLGVTAPFFSSQVVTQKLVLADYHYRYGSNGQTVSVNGQAAEAGLGLKTGWESGWAELGGGLRYRYNRVSPEGADNRSDGGQFGFAVTAQGEHRFHGDWAINGIGTYTFGPDSYLVRGRFLRRVGNDLWAGVELITHGDPFYHANQAGLVLNGIRLGDTVSLGFYGGVKKTSGQSRAFYGGLEVLKWF